MPTQNHIHKWKRLQYQQGRKKVDKLFKGERTFICAFPDCNTTKPLNEVKDKYSVCTKCGETFILGSVSITRVNPRCLSCMNTKESRLALASQELVTEFFKDMETNEPPESMFPTEEKLEQDANGNNEINSNVG